VVRSDLPSRAGYGATGSLQYSQLPLAEGGVDLDADDDLPSADSPETGVSGGSDESRQSLLG